MTEILEEQKLKIDEATNKLENQDVRLDDVIGKLLNLHSIPIVMNKNKFDKRIKLILVILFVLIIFDKLIKNALILFNVIPFYNDSTLFLSFFTIVFLGIFKKNRYWIISCVLMSINVLLSISVKKILGVPEFPAKDMVYIVAMVLGIILCIPSFLYVIYFLKLKNFENYFRF